MRAGHPVATCLGAFAAALISASAAAKICDPTPGAPHDAVAAAVWTDTAQFSFLVGRDFDDPASNTVLIARLRPFGSYPAVRRDAGTWQSTYAEITALAAAIAQSRADVGIIGGLCRNLDDAAFGDVAFDRVTWTHSLDGVRSRLSALAGRARALEAQLHDYDTALNAAASSYAGAGHAGDPYMRLGPEPSTVAHEIDELWHRWRAIVADLAFTGTNLPQVPDTASEAGIVGLTSAATTLANTAAAAAAIARAMPTAASISRLFTGDYLYDACPIVDGRSYYLSNNYYQRSGGVLTGAGNNIWVFGKGAAIPLITTTVGTDALQIWRFRKIGSGYWGLQIAWPTPAPLFLDVLNDAAQHYPLLLGPAVNGQPGYTGQFWRCYVTEIAGRYRFSNRFLGETLSIDTFSNNPQAIMQPTGPFAAQYWGLSVK